MHTITTKIVFALIVAAITCSCVNDSKIDTTNATLEANLNELRKMNENMVVATDSINNLGKPVDNMGKRFDRLVDILEQSQGSFNEFMKVGLQASREMVRLSEAVTPEKLQEFQKEINEFMTTFVNVSNEMGKLGSDLNQSTRHLILNCAMLTKIGRSFGTVSEEEWQLVKNSVIEVIDNTADISEEVKEKAKAKLDEINGLSVAPDDLEKLQNDLHELAQVAEFVTGLLDSPQTGEMAAGFLQLMPKFEQAMGLLERLVNALEKFSK